MDLTPPLYAADWLPVTTEELQLTSEPKAPGAAAIYLYRQVDSGAAPISTGPELHSEGLGVSLVIRLCLIQLIELKCSRECNAGGDIRWSRSWRRWRKPASRVCRFPSLPANMVFLPACSSGGDVA